MKTKNNQERIYKSIWECGRQNGNKTVRILYKIAMEKQHETIEWRIWTDTENRWEGEGEIEWKSVEWNGERRRRKQQIVVALRDRDATNFFYNQLIN